MLVLVVVTLLVSAFLPLRELLRQRGQIDELAQSNLDARTRVAELEAERGRLQDPAYVAAEARRRLHFVMPGETAYILIEPTPDPTADDASSRAPWYSQLWDSAREADAPRPEPTPMTPAPVPTLDAPPADADQPAELQQPAEDGAEPEQPAEDAPADEAPDPATESPAP